MEDLILSNRVHISIDQYDISQDISIRLFLDDLTRSEVLVIAELFYLPNQFPFDKLFTRLDSEIQSFAVSVLEKLKERGLIQFNGKEVSISKEAKKQLEPYVERYEEDFEIDFSFLFNGLRQIPVDVVPNWFSIHRVMTSFQDAIIEKYFETPLLFQRFTQEITIDDPYAKELLTLLLKDEDFELSIDEVTSHFSASKEAIFRSVLALEFSLVAGWVPATDHSPSKVSLVKEIKNLYKDLRKRLPSPSSATPENTSYSLEERLSHLIQLLSSQTLDRSAFLKQGPVREWLEIHRRDADTESLNYDLDVLISLGLIKEASSFIVTKPGFDWLAQPVASRKMDLYLRHRPLHESSPLSDRALKQIERSIFEKQPGVWLEKIELAKSLLWTSGEEGSIYLVAKGKNWYYHLPSHSEETLKFLVQIIDWLSEVGYLKQSSLEEGSNLVLIPLESRSLFIQSL